MTGAATAAAVAGRGQRVVLIEMRSRFAEAHTAGLRNVQLLNADPVREILPAATGPFIGAIYSPVDVQCQPEKAPLTSSKGEAVRRGHPLRNQGHQPAQRAGRMAGVNTTAARVRTDAAPVLGEIASDLSQDGHTKREIKEFRLSRFTDRSVGRDDDLTIRYPRPTEPARVSEGRFD